MSYLNREFSLSSSIEQPMESNQTESGFLKAKLIQTHSKLIQELEYSKKLEEELDNLRYKNELTNRSNDQLNRKLQLFSNKLERSQQDKAKQLEMNLIESEKKNDLLRGDLQTMRGKTLELVATNQKLQEQYAQYQRSSIKLNEKLAAMTKHLKLAELAQQEYKQQAERYRLKYDKQIAINQQIELQLQDAKREKEELQKRVEDLEMALRVEKERQGKNFSEVLMLQKENKDWKMKAQEAFDQISKIKDEAYQTKIRAKGDQRNLAIELQKLTQDYNNLQLMLRQRQAQFESSLSKTTRSYSRKKNTLQQTKDLLGKLQNEQNRATDRRMSPNGKSSPTAGKALRSYKQEKDSYMSMIESVGSMESQMLNCNVERRKILAEMDKIDETRIKTKDMVSKRRRLQTQLQNQEQKLESIREQLKRMKVL